MCIRMAWIVFASVLIPASARADVRPGISVSAMEYLGTPWTTHYGVYPCVGGYLAIPVDTVTASPGLCVEYSPEFGAWGFFPSVAVDLPVAKSLGVDIIVSAWNDQLGSRFRDAALYAGGGVGASYFLDDHWTLSASFNTFAGLNAPAVDVVVAPSAGIGYTF